MSSMQSFPHFSPSREEVAYALKVLAAAKSYPVDGNLPGTGENLDLRLRSAERIISFRRSRSAIFDDGLFGEASWDILLSLYVAHRAQYRMTVTAVCNEAGVPQTTALRWLQHLVDLGLVSRRPNNVDRRAIYVELTSAAIERMNILIDGVLSLDT